MSGPTVEEAAAKLLQVCAFENNVQVNPLDIAHDQSERMACVSWLKQRANAHTLGSILLQSLPHPSGTPATPTH
jgi:hypothetical protein